MNAEAWLRAASVSMIGDGIPLEMSAAFEAVIYGLCPRGFKVTVAANAVTMRRPDGSRAFFFREWDDHVMVLRAGDDKSITYYDMSSQSDFAELEQLICEARWAYRSEVLAFWALSAVAVAQCAFVGYLLHGLCVDVIPLCSFLRLR